MFAAQGVDVLGPIFHGIFRSIISLTPMATGWLHADPDKQA
jgi:hypothetical protein